MKYISKKLSFWFISQQIKKEKKKKGKSSSLVFEALKWFVLTHSRVSELTERWDTHCIRLAVQDLYSVGFKGINIHLLVSKGPKEGKTAFRLHHYFSLQIVFLRFASSNQNSEWSRHTV